jgi:hypothetical protein
VVRVDVLVSTSNKVKKTHARQKCKRRMTSTDVETCLLMIPRIGDALRTDGDITGSPLDDRRVAALAKLCDDRSFILSIDSTTSATCVATLSACIKSILVPSSDVESVGTVSSSVCERATAFLSGAELRSSPSSNRLSVVLVRAVLAVLHERDRLSDAPDDLSDSIGDLLVNLVDAIVALADDEGSALPPTANAATIPTNASRDVSLNGTAATTSPDVGTTSVSTDASVAGTTSTSSDTPAVSLVDGMYDLVARELNLHLSHLLEPARAVRSSLPDASRAALVQQFAYDSARPLAYVDASRGTPRATAVLVCMCLLLVCVQQSAAVTAAFVLNGAASRLLSLLSLDDSTTQQSLTMRSRDALRIGVMTCVGRVLRLASTREIYQACSENVRWCALSPVMFVDVVHVYSCCCLHCCRLCVAI